MILEKETTRLDLPPELSALEASLASLTPRMEPERRRQAKTDALLKSCRLAEELVPPLSGDKLIETIVASGKQEISLSLHEYVKSERRHAIFFGTVGGVVLGLVLGIALGFVGALVAVRSLPLNAPTPVYRLEMSPEFMKQP